MNFITIHKILNYLFGIFVKNLSDVTKLILSDASLLIAYSFKINH
jgi:hypothetical protein